MIKKDLQNEHCLITYTINNLLDTHLISKISKKDEIFEFAFKDFKPKHHSHTSIPHVLIHADFLKKIQEYELKLNKALKELRKGNYLDVKNLEENYSPKFANMLEDINTSPGTVLVYSQFRVVEGLGIFKEVLNKQGYIEINITKSEEYGYIFENPDVFDKKYDNKRYVVKEIWS